VLARDACSYGYFLLAPNHWEADTQTFSRVLELDEGFARVSGKHDPAFDGVNHTFHGGLLATLADCTAWVAIATHTGPFETLVTTELNITYHNPCVGTATASGRVIKLGRSLCPVQIEIHDMHGEIIATARVCYMRVSRE